MPLIQTEMREAIGLIVLDHAARRNVLSQAMVEAIGK